MSVSTFTTACLHKKCLMIIRPRSALPEGQFPLKVKKMLGLDF